MDSASFRRYGHELVDWVADYMDHADRYPVRPRVQPGDIRAQLPAAPPEGAEDWDRILADFRDIVMPGITHWNHPRFFAYFPCNHSGPAILGELLSAGLGVNAMNWQTSPAATELEEVVMDWLRQMLGLPPAFRGAIQDTASTATLAALIAARERLTRGAVNRDGLGAWPERLRVYASAEAHSSVEKDMMVAGFGAANLVKVPVDADYAMDPAALERLIAADRAAGLAPCAVVATVGTTSSTAVDPVPAIAAIARRHACGSTWTRPWPAAPPSCRKGAGCWPAWPRPIRSSSTRTSGSSPTSTAPPSSAAIRRPSWRRCRSPPST